MSEQKDKTGIGCLIIIGIIVLLGLLGPRSTDGPSKPADMSQSDWDYVNKSIKKERPNDSQEDREAAARAVWEYHKSQSE